MKRSKEITTHLDDFAKRAFGRTVTESKEKNICVICGKPADKFRDPLSAKEHSISGLCQACQDGVFGK